jgi:serine/threonine-protein kinase
MLDRERQLSVEEALAITKQVAGALDYAHRQGVIHRDLKPENILLHEGEAMLADFGIALAVKEAGGNRLTETGLSLGTPQYMSPEQATGDRQLDARSDIYSLGAVLYEMLAGEPPHVGATAQAVIAKLISERPTALHVIRPNLPSGVEAAVGKALAKVPADRFASAAAFARALDDSPPLTPPPPPAPSTRTRLVFVASAVVAALLLAWGAWRVFRPKPAAPGSPLLAVLPFHVTGPGADSSLGESMVDLLTINLDGAAGLRVIPAGTVLSRWRREIGGMTVPAEQEKALAVAREAGGRWALTGNIVATSGALRLTAEVYQTDNGQLLGRSQVEGPADSLSVLVDRLSFDLLRSGFMGRVEGLEAPNLARVTTSSLAALRAYLSGERRFRRSQPTEALEDFKRATQADTGFALAYYRLAVVNGWTKSPHAPAPSAADSVALRLASHLPIREQRLIRANAALNSGDPAALNQLDSITASTPQDAEAWYLLGEAEYHLGYIRFHPIDRFRAAMKRALGLDPGFGPAYLHLIDDAIYELDSARVDSLLAQLEGIEPGSPKTQGLQLAFVLSWGDSTARARATARLDTVSDLALLTAKHALDIVPDLSEAAMIPARALFSDARRPPLSRQSGLSGFTMALILEGRTSRALPLLDSLRRALYPEDLPAWQARAQLRLGLIGIGPPTAPPEALGILADSRRPEDHVLLGLYAISRQDSLILQTATREFRRFADGAPHEGNASRSCLLNAATFFEKAWALFRQSPSREDLDALPDEDIRCLSLPFEFTTQLHLRYLAIEHSLASGRTEEAARLFNGISRQLQGPGLVPYRLHLEYARGEVAERSGDREAAQLHYSNLVRWLKDADPDLVPLREQAREALKRVSGEPLR